MIVRYDLEQFNKSLENWLERYEEIQKTIESWYDKAEAAEEKGNTAKAERCYNRAEEYYQKAEGLRIALGCFGYTVKRSVHPVTRQARFVIVES